MADLRDGSRTSRSWRRWALPGLVLVVAAGLWLAGRERVDPTPAVRARLAELCALLDSGGDVEGALRTRSAVIARRVADALRELHAEVPCDAWQPDVRPGDHAAPLGGDDLRAVEATHHVILKVAGRARLGLRLRCDRSEVVVIGYWEE